MTARRHASAPAWVGVGLSIIAMMAALVNWQRNEDLRDVEQRIMEQYKHQVERDQRTQREIGHLREDVRELRTIMLKGAR